MISQEELKRQVHYDPESGEFTRLVTSGGKKKGDKAGYIVKVKSGKKYILISANGKPHHAHRLAFLYMLGRFPINETDHISGDGTDNSWSNLRECTRSNNSRNRRLRSNNKSGTAGVYWDKSSEKWQSQITHNQKVITLGRFKDKQNAINERKSAEIKYGYHENHGQARSL